MVSQMCTYPPVGVSGASAALWEVEGSPGAAKLLGLRGKPGPVGRSQLEIDPRLWKRVINEIWVRLGQGVHCEACMMVCSASKWSEVSLDILGP